MAVNVTQKDKTLHDTIDWCKEQIARINEMIPTASDENFLVGGTVRVASRHRTLRGTVGIFGFYAVGSVKSERESNPLMLPEDTISLFVFRFLA